MSQRHKIQLFLLASIIMVILSAATDKDVFFYIGAGLLAVVILSDLVFGG